MSLFEKAIKAVDHIKVAMILSKGTIFMNGHLDLKKNSWFTSEKYEKFPRIYLFAFVNITR